jgi:osmotically-inducible protein OsmY
MRKTDSQLKQDILDELRWEPSLNEAEIGVAVKDSVVTLSGFVDSFAQKVTAEHCAERVSGVRALADELQVRVPASQQRSDTDIARAAATALDWDVEVPDTGVVARVERGWVWLEGSVGWQYQRAAAERAVRTLIGVRGVTNLIKVHPRKASPEEVSRSIREALRRNAELDADRIEVEASEGTVTLSGTVRSWTERQDVERAAWSAPGVTEVIDQLAISV